MGRHRTANGMQVFTLIWLGQIVSLIGSELTGFALAVWVYQQTGAATKLGLISFFTTMPGLAISPLAGALVDRWDRRWLMIGSDSVAAFNTVILALLLFAGRLEIWHIYLATMATSLIGAFQLPAHGATIPLLVPKQQLGRANGMIQVGGATAQIITPLLAGGLVETVQVQGVMLIDFATFLFAVFTLLMIRVPKPKTTSESKTGKESLLHEVTYSWTYILARPGLLALMIFFATINFLWGIVSLLVKPLVLSFASASALGTVLSIGGSGMLVGSLLIMSAWKGPQRRIYGVLGFTLLGGLCILLAGLRPSILLIAFASFLFFFSLPVVNSSNQTILHSKVAPDVQGRILSMSGMIGGTSLPLAYLVAGPLADQVFEPLMVPNGPLAGSIGQLIGVGPGRGIGLLFIVMGALTILATVVAYQYPRLRLVEDELPDAI